MERAILQEILENKEKYCVGENFIGLGSTRKVFKVNQYVIKVHIHPLGYKQSQNELHIYHKMLAKGFSDFFAQVYYVDEAISLQKYYHPVAMRANQSFEIDLKKDEKIIPNRYEEVLTLLEKEFDGFDLKDSSNYGLNEQGELTFIDYGMNKKLYEKEWVPLAEAGILPQIEYDFCRVCGVKKELRMYGEDDKDKRCYTCGKE